MTTVELIARALAASRNGRVDGWEECSADALLVIEICGAHFKVMPDPNAAYPAASVSSDL